MGYWTRVRSAPPSLCEAARLARSAVGPPGVARLAVGLPGAGRSGPGLLGVLLLRGVLLLGLGLLGSGCDSDVAPEALGPGWLEDTSAPLPVALSEVGLFAQRTTAGALDLERTSPSAVELTPRFPLWSSGSDKRRYLVLPVGGAVDASTEPWVFPVGTAVFKTFAYQGRAIETRVLILTAEGWEFGAYRWADDQSDGVLLELRSPEVVDVPTAGHSHTIPSRLQCRKCHESSTSAVLGASSLQLADQLAALEQGGLFEGPPATAAALDSGDPLSDEVIGYVQGNCVHCHNGGNGINNGYDMRAEVFLGNTVGAEAVGYSAAVPLRVAPGDPAQSLLWLVLSGETDDPEVEDMPPLGVDVRDSAAAATVRAWIESL